MFYVVTMARNGWRAQMLTLTVILIQTLLFLRRVNGDLCAVDICQVGDNAPVCPEGQGVILLHEVLNSPGSTPTLGSCTKAGVFSLLAKVCNARQSCQGHLLRQIQDQCCQSSPGHPTTDTMEVLYNCIQENKIYDVCSSHRLPVPVFHRHILSPNFTDEAARRETVRLPFCQWSIPIPAGASLTLNVNDLYVGARVPCDGETSFRLKYRDSSGSYQHLPASALCGSPDSTPGVIGYSRDPITVPDGATRAIIWFTPVSHKERLWFSYKITDMVREDVPYSIPGQLGCGSHLYKKPSTTTTTATTTTTDTTLSTTTFYVPNSSGSEGTLSSTKTPILNTVLVSTRSSGEAEVKAQEFPVDRTVTEAASVSPWQCAAQESDHSQQLQRFILIGALAGVGVVAVVFLITSLILFSKLVSRSRSPANGLVRFIKADRLDSKPVVMEVECVDRTSPHFSRTSHKRRANILLNEPRDRTMSVHSSESPIYALPYKQPAIIRHGSSKRSKSGQHRVMIIEDPCRKSTEIHERSPSKHECCTLDDDMLSLISGCTVTSSGVSVSDADTADLKELMNSLKKGNGSSLNPKVSSVKVRAEMRRPRFPPDVGTDPVVRLPAQTPMPTAHVTNLYINSHRAAQDGGYDLCRPFPVCTGDYADNPT